MGGCLAAPQLEHREHAGRTWVDSCEDNAVLLVLVRQLHRHCEPQTRLFNAGKWELLRSGAPVVGEQAIVQSASEYVMHIHSQTHGFLLETKQLDCARAGALQRHSQRTRAALEARYDASSVSKGPCGASMSLAAAATGLTEPSLELMTATTFRPPSFACAQPPSR
jgi:hypothetical protein